MISTVLVTAVAIAAAPRRLRRFLGGPGGVKCATVAVGASVIAIPFALVLPGPAAPNGLAGSQGAASALVFLTGAAGVGTQTIVIRPIVFQVAPVNTAALAALPQQATGQGTDGPNNGQNNGVGSGLGTNGQGNNGLGNNGQGNNGLGNNGQGNNSLGNNGLGNNGQGNNGQGNNGSGRSNGGRGNGNGNGNGNGDSSRSSPRSSPSSREPRADPTTDPKKDPKKDPRKAPKTDPKADPVPAEAAGTTSATTPDKRKPGGIAPVASATPVKQPPADTACVASNDLILPLPYTVKPGDTLSRLAERTGVALEDIEKANPQLASRAVPPAYKSPWDYIRDGEKLFVPMKARYGLDEALRAMERADHPAGAR